MLFLKGKIPKREITLTLMNNSMYYSMSCYWYMFMYLNILLVGCLIYMVTLWIFYSNCSLVAACWILVYFPAEDAVGHPILLQEVETLMGDTGDQAGLGEGDTCLAPFFVGDRLHTARIIKCSGSYIHQRQKKSVEILQT